MQRRVQKLTKLIFFDVLGGLLIIAAILTGWLPGPGGIPLFLAGLGFLAVNHDWARNLLKRAEKEGVAIMEKLFPDNRTVQILYDIADIFAFALWISIFVFYDQKVGRLIAFFVLGISFGILLCNRRRYQRFATWLKHIFHKA